MLAQLPVSPIFRAIVRCQVLAQSGRGRAPDEWPLLAIIIAKVSQETLAEMIGITRSRVDHFMNNFQKLGFINYNGHMEVHSSLLSVVLNDQPQIRR